MPFRFQKSFRVGENVSLVASRRGIAAVAETPVPGLTWRTPLIGGRRKRTRHTATAKHSGERVSPIMLAAFVLLFLILIALCAP